MLSIKEKRKYLLDLYDSFGFKDDAPVVLEFQYRDADVVNDMYNFVKKYEGILNHSRFKFASGWYYDRKYHPELVVNPEKEAWEFDSDGKMIVYIDGERFLI